MPTFQQALSSIGLGGNLFHTFISFAVGLLFLLFFGGVGFWIYRKYKKKAVYVHPVRLVRYLENGGKKELNGLKGGKVINASGVWDFQVLMPKGKKHNLGYTPDFSKVDSDGLLVFITSGDSTLWQQIEERIMTEEEITYDLTEDQINEVKESFKKQIEANYPKASEKEKKGILNTAFNNWLKENQKVTQKKQLLLKPIPTEIKTATINNLQGWKAVLDKQKLTVYSIAVGAFIIMVIAHLVSLFIQTKIRCPT